jgi:hypothetical protein
MLLIFADLLDFWVPRITDPIVCKSCAPHKVAKSRKSSTLCGANHECAAGGLNYIFCNGTHCRFAQIWR